MAKKKWPDQTEKGQNRPIKSKTWPEFDVFQHESIQNWPNAVENGQNELEIYESAPKTGL